MKISLFSVILITLNTSFAFASQTEEVQNFKSYMLFHEHAGCPDNSECSAAMGKRYLKWSQAVKNKKKSIVELDKIRQSNGVPLEIWIKEKASKNKDFIFWESPCRQHNQEGQEKIGMGIALVSNINELIPLEKKGDILLRRLYRVKNGKIKSYYSLRGENPLYLDGERLVFKKNIDGAFYSLAIGGDGLLQIIPRETPHSFPESAKCPKEMLKKIEKVKHPKNLYADFYCQKIWNKNNRQMEYIFIGWSCN